MWDDGNDSFSSYEVTEHKMLDGSETGSRRPGNNSGRFVSFGFVLLGLLCILVGSGIAVGIASNPNSGTVGRIFSAALAIGALVGGVAIMIKKPKS